MLLATAAVILAHEADPCAGLEKALKDQQAMTADLQKKAAAAQQAVTAAQAALTKGQGEVTTAKAAEDAAKKKYDATNADANATPEEKAADKIVWENAVKNREKEEGDIPILQAGLNLANNNKTTADKNVKDSQDLEAQIQHDLNECRGIKEV